MLSAVSGRDTALPWVPSGVCSSVISPVGGNGDWEGSPFPCIGAVVDGMLWREPTAIGVFGSSMGHANDDQWPMGISGNF